ncbi:hypothetical protein RchiOBHm_Chr7g0215461 [Rosa chinensis]|uniref:Secreted protein n=1 Tax=Rosa chinensis TaxID=74649 RepID=A0A2P6PBI2_ROSCH|nr:hypothetical protein RchiOBHm_Chr7g0215461 [Rosa chinensis]
MFIRFLITRLWILLIVKQHLALNMCIVCVSESLIAYFYNAHHVYEICPLGECDGLFLCKSSMELHVD